MNYDAMRHATFYMISKERQRRREREIVLRWAFISISLVAVSIILTIATYPYWRPM